VTPSEEKLGDNVTAPPEAHHHSCVSNRNNAADASRLRRYRAAPGPEPPPLGDDGSVDK
jgi:hypothetical protein